MPDNTSSYGGATTPPPPQLSPDGRFWWTGTEWRPFQPDGRAFLSGTVLPLASASATQRGLNLNPKITRAWWVNVAVVALLGLIAWFGFGLYQAEQNRHRQQQQVDCLGYALGHDLDADTYCADR